MKRIAIFFTLTLAVIFGGCSSKYTILNLQTAPDRFLSTEVTVVGRVVQTLDDRNSEFDYYSVADKSGEIWILTKRGVPLRGSAYEVHVISTSTFERKARKSALLYEKTARTEMGHCRSDYGYETISAARTGVFTCASSTNTSKSVDSDALIRDLCLGYGGTVRYQPRTDDRTSSSAVLWLLLPLRRQSQGPLHGPRPCFLKQPNNVTVHHIDLPRRSYTCSRNDEANPR